jgi:hypothetical protein
MEAADAAEQIRETLEEEREEAREVERFRSIVALIIAIMAMLLAITSLGGGNVAEDMINSNIHASDTWAFYQAKNVRQTQYRLAADGLELQLLSGGASLSPEARKKLEETLEKYRATVERYESEPDPADPKNPLKGEGKKELRARAESYSKDREKAQAQDPNFDYAEALFQIAIVLASVAILANSRPVLGGSLALGAAATLLMLNGYYMLFPLPF